MFDLISVFYSKQYQKVIHLDNALMKREVTHINSTQVYCLTLYQKSLFGTEYRAKHIRNCAYINMDVLSIQAWRILSDIQHFPNSWNSCLDDQFADWVFTCDAAFKLQSNLQLKAKKCSFKMFGLQQWRILGVNKQEISKL